MEVHVREVARHIAAAMLATTSLVGSAQAQEYGGWTAAKLASAVAQLQPLPPDERNLRQTELIAQYTLDQVWALSKGQGADGLTKPAVKVHESGLPAFVERGTLSVPLQFFAQVTGLSLMVGHDAAVAAGSEIPVAVPLLFKPFADGRLLSIIPEAGSLFEPGNDLGVFGLAMMGACSPQAADCQRAQGIAMLCTAVFVVGHEVGHLREQHPIRNSGVYPIDEELRADARGLETLKRYLRNLQSSGEAKSDMESTACLASPVAFFELNGRRRTAERVKADYVRRRDALLDALGDRRSDIASLVEPGVEASGIGTVKVSWSATPTLVLLDGVPVDTADLDGLALPIGRHRLVALSQSGIGVAEFSVRQRQAARVQLAFRAFETTGQAELSSLVRAKQWVDVLASTSDSALRPRDGGVAVAHWTALQGLRLGTLIDRRDLGLVATADARKARRWRAAGLPLTSWDPALSDGVE